MNSVVAFDMDGTLIDSAADIGAAANRMRASFGLKPLPRGAVVRMVGNVARVLVARATADAPGLDQDEAFRRYRHEYDTHLIDETKLYPGVPEGLEALKAAGRATKILWLSDKLSNLRSFFRLREKEGDAFWRYFHQKDPARQAWYYRAVAECTKELADTGAWREYEELVGRVFEGVKENG